MTSWFNYVFPLLKEELARSYYLELTSIVFISRGSLKKNRLCPFISDSLTWLDEV